VKAAIAAALLIDCGQQRVALTTACRPHLIVLWLEIIPVKEHTRLSCDQTRTCDGGKVSDSGKVRKSFLNPGVLGYSLCVQKSFGGSDTGRGLGGLDRLREFYKMQLPTKSSACLIDVLVVFCLALCYLFPVTFSVDLGQG